ncbi:MAG: ribosome biogenesis GTPase Der [Deltaproteobacteria bacterium]
MKNESLQLIALVGKPNVGKSSLFNRLTKSNKAIVDPTPGVTRDRHYEKMTWNGKTFMLVDTGGVATDDSDDMTSLISSQTRQAIEEADIICFMLDGRQGISVKDQNIAEMLRRCAKPVFGVVNKVDSPEQESLFVPQFYELGLQSLWPVSAAHGYGVRTMLDQLTAFIKEAEVPQTLPENTISIACIGRPNVGKSSLINKLVGEDRMVVSDVPGTTRDSVDTLLQRDEKHYLLIDTAGIRRKGRVKEKLEKYSVMRALLSMEKCDITLLLIDAAEGITEQDTKVIGYALERGRACIILLNKWDLIKGDSKRQKYLVEEVNRAARFVNYAPILHISALTGQGLQRILPTIEKVYQQYKSTFPTNRLNRILQKAVEGHAPPLYKGRKTKLYYTTQISSRPPTFVVFSNYPKGVHFSYHRYLVNQFRAELKMDKAPLTLFIRERQRKKYG